MNLDLAAAAMTGWIALCVFGLHVVSSPRHGRWMTLPPYVRRGLLVTGAMFTWRSVNFATLPGPAGSSLGHINAEGLLAACALAYTITALAVWAWRRRLPAKGWDRLGWVESQERADPEAVPVMMKPDQLAEHARAQGIHVNGEPPK